MFSRMILIKDGQVIDGTGRPPIRADILIKGDRISAIGSFPEKTADTVIPASGALVVPGFIDVNTDSDHYLTLFTHPSQREFLLQGVTTIIGGHCGSSLAPLIYGSLESIRKWADINQVNVNWHSVAEFFKVLSEHKIGVNFGMLVGHSTIRRALIGEALRDLTTSEVEVFKGVVRQSLDEGALGFSTGLGYAHARQVPYAEIKSLVEIVKKYDGVYATHLRDEREGIIASVGETVLLAKDTKVKTLISHFRPISGAERDYETCLELLDAEANMTDIHFDNYPFDTSVVAIYTLLPSWVQNGGLEIMLANIKSPYLRDRILAELPALSENDLVVAQAPGNGFLVGKTIGEFSRNREVSLKQGLLQLMIESNLRAVVLYKNINLDLTLKSLMRPNALVASNSPSLAEAMMVIKHERATSTFPTFLRAAAAEGGLPIEKAVQKLTNIPARKFGLQGRGEIREGNYADISIIKDGAVTHVFVNGETAVKSGKFENALAGRVLTKT